ncbi:hypothetical protein FHETE_5891 [Fusarium heterosporum]|uniref:Uncharacterized protein n=1 Tax=Fusarium heterosporum TaxID=42747 RepID=A0A8H5WR24_FUSHE|nr:hypothetical protein FHETE_5891 [Fusarium heterosporum]
MFTSAPKESYASTGKPIKDSPPSQTLIPLPSPHYCIALLVSPVLSTLGMFVTSRSGDLDGLGKNRGHGNSGQRNESHQSPEMNEKGLVNGSWFPGPRSLREVAVRVHSDTWLDQDSMEIWYTRICFRGSMKLPNISSLYFRGTRPQYSPTSININYQTINHAAPEPITEFLETAELRHAADALPAGCSSVEQLLLEMVCDTHTDRKMLATGPRALKTYTLRGARDISQNQSDFLPLVNRMVPQQNDSLESIVAYNAWGFRRQGCALYHPDGDIDLRRCSQLRRVHIQIDDLIKDTFYNFPWGVGSVNGAYLTTDDMAENILIEMVESVSLPDFKAIYFDPIQACDQGLFPDLIEIGWQGGVDIHIRGNAHQPRHKF